ncbi:hypothetical protein S40285_08933 [Stachybotrys chlorohalonatus IBT 40285]|uniref:FAD dependent oxidoreductase domain-containing protein n=1 Tax=Stachybotrys chlorohalonatus (strain IBT 40285) TaxID=1283841 RepID=A0A084Q7U9_STAC4|nr:hypothetical protein S40285_08933 [Stachybotrys chlorohalonata IBT 40285]
METRKQTALAVLDSQHPFHQAFIMKLFAILVSLVALAIGADASCRGDCRIQCNPYNIPGACSNECVGRCMAARCPDETGLIGIFFQESIVIVGAGIIGLDVALVLAERGFGRYITVYAEYLPGDTAVSYTSPWAGCNFSAISGSDANALRWDRAGYTHLTKLAAQDSKQSFVQKTPSIELWDDAIPREKIKAMSEYLEDFRILPDQELPPGVKFGVSFTSVTLHGPKHLVYLCNKLKHNYGVRFVRKKLDSIRDAFANPATKVVFNCVGNAARTLPGVEDPECFPTRGQVVLTRAPKALSAELRQEEPEILAAFAGLRPSRNGGARVERGEVLVGARGEKRAIVHNYGAGGTGFQAGYGMATEAVDAAEDILRSLRSQGCSRL